MLTYARARPAAAGPPLPRRRPPHVPEVGRALGRGRRRARGRQRPRRHDDPGLGDAAAAAPDGDERGRRRTRPRTTCPTCCSRATPPRRSAALAERRARARRPRGARAAAARADGAGVRAGLARERSRGRRLPRGDGARAARRRDRGLRHVHPRLLARRLPQHPGRRASSRTRSAGARSAAPSPRASAPRSPGAGPALSVSGDGGFLYACGELATAAQERIPLTAVVVDDGGYGMLRFDQDLRGDPHEGVDLVTPDFAALAALVRRAGGGRGRARCALRTGARAPPRAGRALAARGERRARPAAERVAALVPGTPPEPMNNSRWALDSPIGGRGRRRLPIYAWIRGGPRSSGSASPSASRGWRTMGPHAARRRQALRPHAWYSAWFLAFGEPRLRCACASPGRVRQPRGRVPARAPPRRSLAGMANVHTPVFRPVGRSREGCAPWWTPRSPAAAATSTCRPTVRRHVAHRCCEMATAEAGRRHMIAEPARVAHRRHDRRPTRTGGPVAAALGRAARALPPQDAARAPDGARRWSARRTTSTPSWSRGFAVEASGWKGASGTAILSDARTMTFYRAVRRVVRRARRAAAYRAS